MQHPDLGNIEIPAKERKIKNKVAEVGYYKIARHYKWALTQVFEEMNHEYVIIVEGMSQHTRNPNLPRFPA